MGNSVARDFWREVLDLRIPHIDGRDERRPRPTKTKVRVVRTFPSTHRPR